MSTLLFQSKSTSVLSFFFKHGLIPLLVIAGLTYLGQYLGRLPDGNNLHLSLWFGAAFGLILQRSRFCFYCIGRDFIESRRADGVLGVLAALAVGTLGYHLIFGAFLPVPDAPRLPPGAHIAPVSWVLVLAAFSFGLGMALAGSCISAQLYRLGEGAVSAIPALLGTLLGFVLGFLSWNTVYLETLQAAPVIWFPHQFGYSGSLVLQLVLLGTLAGIVFYFHQKTNQPADSDGVSWRQKRWPTYVGGILIGALSTMAYLRVAPLGVTAELGSWARTAADALEILPSRLEGLDTLRGCATVIKASLWSNNGVFIFSLVIASFAAAIFSGDFHFRLPSLVEAARNFLGGVFMGWGAMLGLGCTVGTLLSGTMAASLSGWIFAVFAALGLTLGWWLRRFLN